MSNASLVSEDDIGAAFDVNEVTDAEGDEEKLDGDDAERDAVGCMVAL
jgi:hypothetical protein